MEKKQDKIFILIRGAAGSGKSFLAESLASLSNNCIICEADEFFGKPNKDNTCEIEIVEAHRLCREKFLDAISNSAPLVICSNVNSSKLDYHYYLSNAVKYGYRSHVILSERVFNTINVHNVPEEVVLSQMSRIRKSIQF
jgi:predicted ABC-type ATPase